MPRPEETLDELARLAREDEALSDRLPPELSTPLSAEKTAALVGAIQGKLTTRARRRNLLAAGAAVAAMAAGVALFVGQAGPAAPLPEYEARVEGGQQSERSSSPKTEMLRLKPESRLRFELRPRSDHAEPVRARVELLGSGKPGEALALETTDERSPAGALKVEARLPGSLPLHGEILVTVERAGTSEGSQRFSWPFERSP